MKRASKSKRGLKIQIKFSNRLLYTLIALGIVLIIATGVYAATYTASGAGHPYTEISACGTDGQILKMVGGVWACAADDAGSGTSQWGTSGSNIYFPNPVSGSGKVGIGTTSPNSLLEIRGAGGGASFRVGNNNAVGTQYISIDHSSALSTFNAVNTQNAIYPSYNFNSQNNAGTVTRMAIDGSGNVGIGTTSPASKLNVIGTFNATGGAASVKGLYVDNTGKVGIGTTSPVSTLNVVGTLNVTGLFPTTKGLYVNPSGNVGIGTITISPNIKLEVNGNVKITSIQITGGSPGVGKVLISDANGVATWAPATTSCPSGWNNQISFCSKEDFNVRTWQVAVANCNAQGAHLCSYSEYNSIASGCSSTVHWTADATSTGAGYITNVLTVMTSSGRCLVSGGGGDIFSTERPITEGYISMCCKNLVN